MLVIFLLLGILLGLGAAASLVWAIATGKLHRGSLFLGCIKEVDGFGIDDVIKGGLIVLAYVAVTTAFRFLTT